MIPLFKVHMPESVTRPLLDTLFSGFIGQGEKVDEFECKLLKWVQNKNVLTLNSGTTGLHLALHLAGIGPGDEVIASPFSCTATSIPIHHSGATIVWADVNPETGNIDPNCIERIITAKTKAIVAVHWAGYPFDLKEINDIATQYGLKVIEDAAHAFGAVYQGKMIGSISDFTMFSLQAIKHISTIDGGLLTCKSADDYKRGKLLRWYGMDRETESRELRCKQDVPEAGWKWHMNDVCATVGIEQLNYIDGILEKHRSNADYYFENLQDLDHVTLLNYQNDRLSSYWLFTILVEDRESFTAFMTEKDVHVSRAHVCHDWHSCFTNTRTPIKLAGAKLFDAHQINIPVGWWLTPADRKHIVESIKEWDNSLRH